MSCSPTRDSTATPTDLSPSHSVPHTPPRIVCAAGSRELDTPTLSGAAAHPCRGGPLSLTTRHSPHRTCTSCTLRQTHEPTHMTTLRADATPRRPRFHSPVNPRPPLTPERESLRVRANRPVHTSAPLPHSPIREPNHNPESTPPRPVSASIHQRKNAPELVRSVVNFPRLSTSGSSDSYLQSPGNACGGSVTPKYAS